MKTSCEGEKTMLALSQQRFEAREEARPSLVRAEFAPVLPRNTGRGRVRDDEQAHARAARVALMGSVGRDPEVLADARDAVQDHLASPPPGAIPADVLDVLVPLAALEGGRICSQVLAPLAAARGLSRDLEHSATTSMRRRLSASSTRIP
jgi:hypothetical protein